MSSCFAQYHLACLDLLHNSEMSVRMEIEQMHGLFMTLQVSFTVAGATLAMCI